MSIVKYILRSLIAVISLALGGGVLDSTQYSLKEYIFIYVLGVIILFILGLIFSFFAFKVFKNKSNKEVWGFVCTLGLFLVFCGICIL